MLSTNEQKIEVEFQKGDYDNGQNGIQLTHNSLNQSQAMVIDQTNYKNICSNIILDSNLSYIFRIKVDTLSIYETMYVGLIPDQIMNTTYGYSEKLCCRLQNTESQIERYPGSGIDQVLQGEEFILSKENEIEIRVCIKDKILHLLDFPHQKYKIGLTDESITKLTNGQNFRLYVGLAYANSQVTLIESKIVNSFE